MKIPNKIKIGGKIYSVEITDNLKLGNLNCSGECDYEQLKIRLTTDTCENKKQADLMHEIVHAIADSLGYRNHDEQQIEAFAQALYAVIQDNPEMFETNDKLCNNNANAESHNTQCIHFVFRRMNDEWHEYCDVCRKCDSFSCQGCEAFAPYVCDYKEKI